MSNESWWRLVDEVPAQAPAKGDESMDRATMLKYLEQIATGDLTGTWMVDKIFAAALLEILRALNSAPS